ncbi:uncharacterized protein [Clytia hemisphaerica]|uniref:NIDO domain-containing protein n=2 Tax=Clytia hemisphaerica TaxID=252671 RepID=A0A7M5UV31_9CNID
MAIVVKLLLMVLLVRNCEGSVNELFYPFGDQWNDTTLVGASFYNTFYSVMQLHVPFRSSNRLFIYDSGYVSTDLQTKENPTVNHGIFLYSGFFSSKVGSVSHRQTRNEPVVNKMIEDDLRRYKDHKEPNMKDFVPKNTIIITYYQTYRYLSTQRNVFQAILTYNDQDAYLITNYYVLENAGATVAQTYNGCTHTFAPTFNSNNLQYNTNIGVQGRYVWNVNDVDCEAEKKRYITEDLDGVQILPKGDDVVEKITLSQPMPLFHGLKSEFLLSSDGYLTTCSDNTTLNTHHIRYMWYDYLAFFANDFNVTDESRGTILYYETTTNQELLNRTAADITFFTWRDFKPLHAFVVSYVNCSDKKDRVINFDAIIVTDGYDTYFIFKYFNENFISDVWSFYSSKHCNWDIMGVVGTRWTNTGRTGSSVFKVYDHACMTQVFLPYGSHIDTVKTVADETNFHVYLTKSMPLFTKIGKTLYVNSNGKISYTRDSRNVKSTFLANSISIAPFYLDLYTGGIGRIFYRETFDTKILKRLTEAVNVTGFTCNHAFIATYENMAEYGVHTSRNSFQIALATDGHVTYGVLYYYRVDSYERAAAGYGEAQCNTGHLIVPYSQGELELYGYEINPRVFKLTKEQCKDEIDAYLYPFGKEHGDQVLLYNSSTSMVPFKVQNVLNLFGSEVDTLHISKYGFLSLNEQPADEIVWYPYNKTKIIYGYLTNLPSNVYYRETNDTDILEKYLSEKNILTTINSVVVITFHTDKRGDIPGYHLHTNNFQIVLGSRYIDSAYVGFIYRRLDTLFGVVGFSVPGCFSYEFTKPLETHYLPSQKGGKQGFFGSWRCYDFETAMLPNGIPSGDQFYGYLNDELHLGSHDKYLTIRKGNMPGFDGIRIGYIVISANGMLTMNRDPKPTSKYYNSNNIILGYVQPNWVNFNNKDATFVREIARNSMRNVHDRITLDMLNNAVNKYKTLRQENSVTQPFNGNHAVVITFNTINGVHYQYGLISNGSETHVVMNFLSVGGYGFHGVSNPACTNYSMTLYISSFQEATTLLLDGSNTGVKGQYVYPITHRICEELRPKPPPPTMTPATTTTTIPFTAPLLPKSTESLFSTTTSHTTTITKDSSKESQAGGPEPSEKTFPVTNDQGDTSSNQMPIIIGAVVGGSALLVLVTAVVVVLKRRSARMQGYS